MELSNLQRQMLFDEKDVKQASPKSVAAKSKLHMINSSVNIEAVINHVNTLNINDLDGTDNFSTRYLINDVCFKITSPFLLGVLLLHCKLRKRLNI